MGFRNNAYAKIWKKEEKGKYSVVALTVSHKNKEGEYVTDFSDNYVRFVGPAHEALKAIEAGARVQLKSVDTTTFYDKEKKVQHVNFVVFAFDLPGEFQPTMKNETKARPVEVPTTQESEDDLPF